MTRYATKTAVIIGGTHGMGRATAEMLVDGGARVLLTGSGADTVAAAAQAFGDRACVVRSDVTDARAVDALGARVAAELGDVDLLFLNAGHARLVPLADADDALYQRTFDVNVRGPYFTARRLAPLLRAGGSLVFTTSIANESGYPGMSLYAGAKAAVRAFVRNLAAELAPRGVRVNAVSPGFIDTPTMGVSGASAAELEAFAEEGRHTTPMKRIGEPSEVARAVLFLAFEATFTTGAELPVDGGLGQL